MNDFLLGPNVMQAVRKSNILIVGAGGIGCELIKNAVMSGFTQIEIVDLDTIDVTNLNRQFLFQRQHISKPKSWVARESALVYNPSICITAHHANIKDAKFDLVWFKSFDIVFNALDNLEARRHVNLMCIASNVNLIDAGTGGYLGQSIVIIPKKTECYDCEPKSTPKTYPVCTIRSSPSAPIHCIVWAKNFLFNQLFQKQDNDSELKMVDETIDKNQIEELAREAGFLKDLQATADSPDYAHRVLQKVYVDDLVRIGSFTEMWKKSYPPMPLNWTDLKPVVKQLTPRLLAEPVHSREARVLNKEEAVSMFLHTVSVLGKRFMISGPLEFDKDDTDAMAFVTYASQLRSMAYGITPLKTYFETKSMAGNIIPIVATTNAIVAGTMTIQALQLSGGKSIGKPQRNVHTLTQVPIGAIGLVTRKEAVITRHSLMDPVKSCSVCTRAYVHAIVDTETATLDQMLKVIVLQFPVLEWDNMVVAEGERILYDPDMYENGNRTLNSLGVHHHTFIRIDQFDSDNVEVQPLTLYVDTNAAGSKFIQLLDPPVTLWTRKTVLKRQHESSESETSSASDIEELEPEHKRTRFE